MREGSARRLERIDAVGGRLVARFWGSVLGLALLFVGVPLVVGSLASGAWAGAAVSALALALGLALVRHLFSSKRRLSEME